MENLLHYTTQCIRLYSAYNEWCCKVLYNISYVLSKKSLFTGLHCSFQTVISLVLTATFIFFKPAGMLLMVENTSLLHTDINDKINCILSTVEECLQSTHMQFLFLNKSNGLNSLNWISSQFHILKKLRKLEV